MLVFFSGFVRERGYKMLEKEALDKFIPYVCVFSAAVYTHEECCSVHADRPHSKDGLVARMGYFPQGGNSRGASSRACSLGANEHCWSVLWPTREMLEAGARRRVDSGLNRVVIQVQLRFDQGLLTGMPTHCI